PFLPALRYSRSRYLLFLLSSLPTTEIYPLSLHDALPISNPGLYPRIEWRVPSFGPVRVSGEPRFGEYDHIRITGGSLGDRVYRSDRKSTRLNSSHVSISYAVFCLKKKKKVQHSTKPKTLR